MDQRLLSKAHDTLAAGHVVALRMTSQDAKDRFKPTCGKVEEISFRPSTASLQIYFNAASTSPSDQQLLAGHVVAVRVTSEDANDGFKPTCGKVEEISFRPSPDVWGYFSIKSGGGIHEFSDSQVGLSLNLRVISASGPLWTCEATSPASAGLASTSSSTPRQSHVF